MVTRATIDGADYTPVTEALSSWTTAATGMVTIAESYERGVHSPGGQPWSGNTAENVVAIAGHDRATVTGLSEDIQALVSNVDRWRAITQGALQAVRDLITAAEAEGFTVGDDLSVTFTDTTPPDVAKQDRAEDLAFLLATYAQLWWTNEQALAALISAADTALTLVFTPMDTHTPIAPPPGATLPVSPAAGDRTWQDMLMPPQIRRTANIARPRTSVPGAVESGAAPTIGGVPVTEAVAAANPLLVDKPATPARLGLGIHGTAAVPEPNPAASAAHAQQQRRNLSGKGVRFVPPEAMLDPNSEFNQTMEPLQDAAGRISMGAFDRGKDVAESVYDTATAVTGTGSLLGKEGQPGVIDSLKAVSQSATDLFNGQAIIHAGEELVQRYHDDPDKAHFLGGVLFDAAGLAFGGGASHAGEHLATGIHPNPPPHEGLPAAGTHHDPVPVAPHGPVDAPATGDHGLVGGDAAPVQLDLTTDHARALGMDPATGGFRAAESETGLRVERELGVDLRRAGRGDAHDWVDAGGRTYDAVGNFPSKFFDSQWPNLQGRILGHLEKAEIVPVDVSQFTAAQREVVREFVQGLQNPNVVIVGGG